MYIKNRINKDGDIILNPEEYIPKYTAELVDFLNEVYVKGKENFDQNNQ